VHRYYLADQVSLHHPVFLLSQTVLVLQTDLVNHAHLYFQEDLEHLGYQHDQVNLTGLLAQVTQYHLCFLVVPADPEVLQQQ